MKYGILAFFLLLTGLKVYLAWRLDLFSDEAFYWQCTLRPQLAYADLPLMTAGLVKLGVSITGDIPLGVRLIFLIMGGLFPWVVHALAKPLVGCRDAWWAAVGAMALPGLGYLGLMAIPDVPMLLFTALFLWGFERGTRTGATGPWLVAGLAAAMGLATHYRFVLAPIAAGVYLVWSGTYRNIWRRKGPWLTVLLAVPGLLPALIYNFQNRLAPLNYFLLGRHGWGFRPSEPLEHLAEQAVLVTPLLYAALLGVLVVKLRDAWAGDDRARLLVCFALVPLGIFFLASPLKDTGPQTVHWPIAGYLSLLVYLPGTMRRFYAARPSKRRLALIWAAPGLGALLLTAALTELATGWFRVSALQHPFLGWSTVSKRVDALLVENMANNLPKLRAKPMVVADNYKLGAHLEFRLHDHAQIYILDHSKNYEHGRQTQYDAWGIGEQGIRRHVGTRALVVVQESEMPRGHEARWMNHVRWFFDPLEPVDSLQINAGSKEKRFLLFWGTVIPKR